MFTVLVFGAQLEFGIETVTVCIPRRTPSIRTGVSLLLSIPSNETCAPGGFDDTSRCPSCARRLPHPPAKTVKHATATTLGSSFLSRILCPAPFPAETLPKNPCYTRQIPHPKRAHHWPNPASFQQASHLQGVTLVNRQEMAGGGAPCFGRLRGRKVSNRHPEEGQVYNSVLSFTYYQ